MLHATATMRYHSVADWPKYLKCIMTNAVNVLGKQKLSFYRWALQTNNKCLKSNLIISSNCEVHPSLTKAFHSALYTTGAHWQLYKEKCTCLTCHRIKLETAQLSVSGETNQMNHGMTITNAYSEIINYRAGGQAGSEERCIFRVLWEDGSRKREEE